MRTDLNLLLLYDNEQILGHFKDFSSRFETEKCVLGADLFYELALIEEAENQPANAMRLKELCLYLYAIGLPKEERFQESQHFEKISTLIKELHNQQLSEKALASLHAFENFIESIKIRKPSLQSSSARFISTVNSRVFSCQLDKVTRALPASSQAEVGNFKILQAPVERGFFQGAGKLP